MSGEYLRPRHILPCSGCAPGPLPSRPLPLSQPFKTQNGQTFLQMVSIANNKRQKKRKTNTIVMLSIFSQKVGVSLQGLGVGLLLDSKGILSKGTTPSSRQRRNWGMWSWVLCTFSLLEVVGKKPGSGAGDRYFPFGRGMGLSRIPLSAMLFSFIL